MNAIFLFFWLLGTVDAGTVPPSARTDTLAIPGGEVGVGYDDLQYAPALKRILVPAGRTGTLVLIDPATRQVRAIRGFSGASSYRGGHGEGTTSAAELDGWPGFAVATDRGAAALRLVDVARGTAGQPVKLSASPDYVRVVAREREVWVTEPTRKQIEVLRVEGREAPRLAAAASITVPDGPESLVIDEARGRAYSHTWKGETFAIDLATRKIVAIWSNGCRGSRGIALDAGRGLVFAGCAEGKVTVVDLTSGKLIASAPAGAGIDSIAFGAALGHLYVPAGETGALWIFDVSARGTLALLGTLPTARDAHTVAVDPVSRSVFVGTPAHGAVLLMRDPFVAPPAR